MTSMIERVAKAICKACGDDPNREGAWQKWWKDSPYLDMARAAIEEMMKPTPEMVKVGETEMMARHTNLDCFQDPYVNSTWEAMITAALKENGE